VPKKVACPCGGTCATCAKMERARTAMALLYYRRMDRAELEQLVARTKARLPLMRKALREKK